MTKSQEGGENEITAEVIKEAVRSGRNVCEILAEMRQLARSAGDSARERKIVQAEKFLGCRNVRKRRKQP